VAYVADGGWGLQILNVSNPASPTLLSNYTASGDTRGVAVSGTVAFTASPSRGFQIISAQQPGEPRAPRQL
jgi:hypothetical protein